MIAFFMLLAVLIQIILVAVQGYFFDCQCKRVCTDFYFNYCGGVENATQLSVLTDQQSREYYSGDMGAWEYNQE